MAKLLFMVLLLYTPASFAETLLEAGIHLGGDELIDQDYTNGAKDSAKAGGLFSFAIGGMKSFSKNIEGQFSIGIKSDIVNPDNPEVTWVRYPLNAMLFYRMDSYRVGLGATGHFSPKVDGNGVASNISEDYKNAIGALFEVDFNVNKSIFWGLRYTNIKYESSQRNRHVNGNSIGLLLIALI